MRQINFKWVHFKREKGQPRKPSVCQVLEDGKVIFEGSYREAEKLHDKLNYIQSSEGKLVLALVEAAKLAQCFFNNNRLANQLQSAEEIQAWNAISLALTNICNGLNL